jgi:hypothetical protein
MPKSLIVRSRSEACVDSGKGFVCTTGPKAVASGNNYLFFMTSGSTKVIRITKIIISCDATMRARITQAPTVTGNGTSLNMKNRRMGKGQTPEAACYTAPTVTAEGDVLYDQWLGAAITFVLDMTNSPWTVDPGNSLVVNMVAGGANNASVTLEWDEEVR